MFPKYKINSDEISVSGNLVLDSTTQARLDANQTSCTLKLRDLSDGADESNQTIDLTYQANGNYTFPGTSINAVMTAGNKYQGTISKAGMLDIEIHWQMISSDEENLTTQQKTDVKTQIDTALGTDTISEPSAGTPPTNPTIKQAIMYPYMALVNEAVSTSSLVQVKNASGSVIAEAAITETAAQVTRAKFTGP